MTVVNINSHKVQIDASSPDNIDKLAPGNGPFEIADTDKNPTFKIKFADPKVPVDMSLINTTNIKDYNVTVTYEDGTVLKFTVSKIFFSSNFFFSLILCH